LPAIIRPCAVLLERLVPLFVFVFVVDVLSVLP